MRLTFALIPLALLAACGSKPDATGSTPEEQQQLNDAAASLDANAASPDEAPADTSADQGNAQ